MLNVENYKFNYQIYYKLGALSMTLANGEILENEIKQKVSLSDFGVGVIIGMGAGLSYVVNEKISIVWRTDYNHITSNFKDIYRVDKIFGEN